MNTTDTPATTPEEITEDTYGSNRATYCPEDDKLRLYVGRVPRDEYEALRAEGWTSTPKQSEAGQGEFAATWTPARRDRALAYAGIIEDEDAGPEERAADRAERFSGYRDKRLGEAGSHADRYDAGPHVHGYQSFARAVRAADRHDRTATRAVDAWDKAEYWTSRTAGVISNALYKSSPSVRMGRIKELELLENRLKDRTDTRGTDWLEHTRLRLAYENQMLEAVGGRAACVEMEVGGWIDGTQILKINRSTVTGNIVSVQVMGSRSGYTKASGYTKRDTWACEVTMNIERLASGSYRAPTDEERAAFTAAKKAKKAAAPKAEPCPLVNPTDTDAQRLQDMWNEAQRKKQEARGYDNFQASEVLRLTQAQYSAYSKGSSHYETVTICETGGPHYIHREKLTRLDVYKVRRANGGHFGKAPHVVVITDKPQKPIPWAAVEAARLKCPTVESMTPRIPEIQEAITNCHRTRSDETNALLADARYVGWFYRDSSCQFGWTEKGAEASRAYRAATLATA